MEQQTTTSTNDSTAEIAALRHELKKKDEVIRNLKAELEGITMSHDLWRRRYLAQQAYLWPLEDRPTGNNMTDDSSSSRTHHAPKKSVRFDLSSQRNARNTANSSNSSVRTSNRYMQPASNTSPTRDDILTAVRESLRRSQRVQNASNSSNADSVMTHNLHTQSASNQTSSSSRTPFSSQLPDLTDYLECKVELATIMRDFTDNRTYFIGHDGHEIGMTEYQKIAKHTKAGEDPARYLQGEAKKFKTGYNKKANTFTENTLFIPKVKFHDVLPTPEANAPQATSNASLERMLLTRQGLFSAEQANTPPNTATTEETKENATPVDEQHATSMSLG